MGDKSKIPTVIFEQDSSVPGSDNNLIIVAPKKKKPKPRRRFGPLAPKAGRPKGGWTA